MCIAEDCLVLAAMLVFLKQTPTWPPHTFLFNMISFLLTHIYVKKRYYCSKMLLSCVVFPTQQAYKYYIALGCDKVK